ncbi:MAG: hypothetical protein ABI548_02855 [Polyangiaceae bacterium]
MSGNKKKPEPKLRLLPEPRRDSPFFLFVVGVSLETHRVYSKMPAKWIAYAAQAAEKFANRPDGVFGTEDDWRSVLSSERGAALVACIAFGLMHRSTMEGLALLGSSAMTAGGKLTFDATDEALEDICLRPFIAPMPKEALEPWLKRRIRGHWGHGSPPNAKSRPRAVRGCPCEICLDLKRQPRLPVREDMRDGRMLAHFKEQEAANA